MRIKSEARESSWQMWLLSVLFLSFEEMQTSLKHNVTPVRCLFEVIQFNSYVLQEGTESLSTFVTRQCSAGRGRKG